MLLTCTLLLITVYMHLDAIVYRKFHPRFIFTSPFQNEDVKTQVL